jgi:hypothetical protein
MGMLGLMTLRLRILKTGRVERRSCSAFCCAGCGGAAVCQLGPFSLTVRAPLLHAEPDASHSLTHVFPGHVKTFVCVRACAGFGVVLCAVACRL